MKLMKLKKFPKLVIGTIIAGAVLAGCQKSDSTGSANTAAGTTQTVTAAGATQEATAKKTVVKVATSGNPNPYTYTDDNNKLVGYDIEILEAVQELLPQYQFDIEITEFQSIFTGIDAGIYQMGVNNISWKEERAEKYLFADEYVDFHDSGILVRKDYNDITSLDDLAGKKTFSTTSGLYSQIFMENYNAEHADNPIDIVYTEADTLKQYQDLSAGVVDFLFGGTVGFNRYTKEYPDLMANFKLVGLTTEEQKKIEDPYGYFIYPKTALGEQIKADVDEALRTLQQNGTYTELGLKYFGYDTANKK